MTCANPSGRWQHPVRLCEFGMAASALLYCKSAISMLALIDSHRLTRWPQNILSFFHREILLMIKLATSLDIKLKSGQTLSLLAVKDRNADLTEDQNLGIASFVNAYKDSAAEDIRQHFGGSAAIDQYYHNLINECDIRPFREGKLLWIRAFLETKLVGWMGLEANYRDENMTYISTFVLDPAAEGKGIGEKMLSSIIDHWLPETSELNLIVRKINCKAQSFFEHFGFSPALDIQHPYNDNPLHCLFMRWRKII
jgi:ribosomal protein S18 acetylase RimI-like enzyme